jgi:hypothetical protein
MSEEVKDGAPEMSAELKEKLEELNSRFLEPGRMENEPFEAYKIRQKMVNKGIKQYLKGRMFYSSVVVIPMGAEGEDKKPMIFKTPPYVRKDNTEDND